LHNLKTDLATKYSLTPESRERRLVVSSEPTIPDDRLSEASSSLATFLGNHVRKTVMPSFGDVSVSQIASSLARDIAASAPATGAGETKPHASVATAIMEAFDDLTQSQQIAVGLSSTNPVVARISPFSTPTVPCETMMNALKEAVGAFNELVGYKQSVLQQLTSLVGDQQPGQVADQQNASNLVDKQLSQSGQADQSSFEDQGVKMLDECARFFSLLQRCVTDEQN
jgi:hypothetical protein